MDACKNARKKEESTGLWDARAGIHDSIWEGFLEKWCLGEEKGQ